MERFDSVEWFSAEMKKRLKENQNKIHWTEESTNVLWLLDQIDENSKKLRSDIHTYAAMSPKYKRNHNKIARKILNQSSDIANFSMMIADIVNKRHKLTRKTKRTKIENTEERFDNID